MSRLNPKSEQSPLALQPVVQAGGDDSADLFDYSLLKDYLAYGVGVIKRHKWFCLQVAVGVTIAVGVLCWALPRTYHSETRLLAQRNQVISVLGNPNRNMPWDSDAPTRAAAETILRHDNLVSIVRQTKLVDRFYDHRAPILRLKDSLVNVLRRGRPIPMEDQIGMMVGTLETKLEVQTAEGTVTIAIDWPDARMAYDLVNAAQSNFLESRYIAEIGTISDAITILERHAAGLREEIEADVERVDAERDTLNKKTGGRPKAAAPVAAAAPRRAAPVAADHSLEELRSALEAKRRAVSDLEEFRDRQLETLKSKLTEAQQIYSDQHPIILELKQRIEELSKTQDSAQLAGLKAERDALETEALRRGAISSKDQSMNSTLTRRLPTNPELIARATTADFEDAPVEQAKGDLRFAISKYQTMLDRIDAAQMEMETARAAFKYRYSVLQPAEVPSSPIKPKVPMIMIAGAVGGLVLAVLLALMRDVRAGRINESWQIERQLEIPLLAQMRFPD